MKKYAYARVSTQDQNLERQISEFLKFGIDKKHIYSDKKSGKDFERKNYIRLIKRLKRDDLIVVKSIDRLGRNYQMIIEEWSHIVNKIGANILVLDMPLLDTRNNGGTLVGKFISDIVLQVLSFVAENERDNIRSRQAEGIALAKARGVRFGRPQKTYTDEFYGLISDYQVRNITIKEALRRSRMSRSNFYYHMKRIIDTEFDMLNLNN